METTANSIKKFNSLDDRGIFCAEIDSRNDASAPLESFHVHNNIEIIYSVDAKIEIRTENDSFLIPKGGLILISPMERHSQAIVGAGLYYSVKFLPAILFSSDQTFSEYKFFNRFISLGKGKRLYTKEELQKTNIGLLFESIMVEWSKKDPGYELMIRADILRMFTYLSRCDEVAERDKKEEFSNDAITRALAYISSNSATVTEQDAAEHCGLSLAYFSTLFKNTVGMKFSDYLMQLKLGRAKGLLLSTDKSITYVAYETGFASSSHFIARFRELEGTTPSKYRRRAQTDGMVTHIKAPAFTAELAEPGRESGHLLVFKYRTNRVDDPPFVPIFISTKHFYPTSDDLSWTEMKADEKWHVIIMDMDRSKQYVKSFLPASDGKFYGGHVHFHLFYKFRSPEQYVDLAYVAYAKSIDDAFSLIGCGEDVSFGYFDDAGYSRWETLNLDIPSDLSKAIVPQAFFHDAKALFTDAGANGISLRRIELLSEGDTGFTRIWCP